MVSEGYAKSPKEPPSETLQDALELPGKIAELPREIARGARELPGQIVRTPGRDSIHELSCYLYFEIWSKNPKKK